MDTLFVLYFYLRELAHKYVHIHIVEAPARRAKTSLFFGQHLSREYWLPGHENPAIAMGIFRGVDQD